MWRLEPLGENNSNLEHVTWSDPTVTPSRLAISSRLSPSATSSLIFSIACEVNLTRLPLAGGMAFMAAPFGRPVVCLGLVSDARCDGHHEMADSRCDGHHKMVDSDDSSTKCTGGIFAS
jgi:hypothetical protein